MNRIDKTEIYDDPRKIIEKAFLDLGEENENVVYISCDSSLGAGGSSFRKRFPERHLEFGTTEQSSISQAAGLALSGKIPFIIAYLPFITFRCFEQIRVDVCKTELNVNIIGNNCGLSVGSLGPTHTSLEEISSLRAIPNMNIISPSDGPEYREAICAAAELDRPTYIRVHRHKVRRINKEDYKFMFGKGSYLKKGKDVTIVSYSSMAINSLEAAKILETKGIEAEVINMPTLKPVDVDILLDSSVKTKKVVTVEEHSVVGGIGSIVAEVLVKENPVFVYMIGINDKFNVTGSYDELIDYYGLTPEKIAVKIENFINR